MHRSRFEEGLELFREFGSGRVVDYGCGDGTLLAMLMATSNPPDHAVGLELDRAVVTSCRARYAEFERLSFVELTREYLDANERAFDTVICMEVLEHVVDLGSVVRDLARIARPGGRVIISVPVETGLPVLLKQTARTVLGWRGVGDYPGTTAYSAGEMLRSVFASDRQHIVRPVHQDDTLESHDHKGFNWRFLLRLLEEHFRVDRVTGTPVRWLPASLNSQVWIVGTTR